MHTLSAFILKDWGLEVLCENKGMQGGSVECIEPRAIWLATQKTSGHINLHFVTIYPWVTQYIFKTINDKGMTVSVKEKYFAERFS